MYGDTINEEDLHVDVSKTQLEREITNKGNEIALLQDQLVAQEKKMAEMMDILKAIQQERMIEERNKEIVGRLE
ncbi:MAG: hypothetical protein ACOCRX_05775 [Candidatus Woesearchaeota archaeon]